MKTNSSWLIFESIKALEIKNSLIFHLDFANNTILSCFVFFFLIIDLYFLIPAVVVQIFNPIAELVFNIILNYTNLFMVFTHQFILVYCFNKILSCFIYIFQSKFLANVSFGHVFKVIIYFQLNQEVLISQLIILLLYSHTYCK